MRYLIVLLVTFLLSCESYTHRTEKVNERLYAFVFDGEKMYALGEKYDYIFENQDVVAFQELMKSYFAKDIIAVDLNFNGIDEQIFAEYAVYLDPKKYSLVEQDHLQKQFWFNPLTKIKPDVVAKMPKSLAWNADNPALKRQYRAVGKRIMLQNRADLLAKYRQNETLNLHYQHDFTRLRVHQEVKEMVALSMVSPLVAVQFVIALATTPVLLPMLIGMEFGTK